MTRAWVLLGVLLAGCDPVYDAAFEVTDARTGLPVAGASIALVDCAGAWPGEALVTDVFGLASVAGAGFELPDCDIVVAAPGYRPYATSFRAICGCPLDECDRVRAIPVALAPLP